MARAAGEAMISSGRAVSYADITYDPSCGGCLCQGGIHTRGSYGTTSSRTSSKRILSSFPVPDDPRHFERNVSARFPKPLARLSRSEGLRKMVQVIHVPSALSGQYLQVYLDLTNKKGVGFSAEQEREGRSSLSREQI